MIPISISDANKGSEMANDDRCLYPLCQSNCSIIILKHPNWRRRFSNLPFLK